MTVLYMLMGFAIVTVAALSILGIVVYANVMLKPESDFSQKVTRIFGLWFATSDPMKDRDAYEPRGSSPVSEGSSSDRPTRAAKAARSLKDLQHGDRVQTSGSLFTVVAAYTVEKLVQRGSQAWVPEGSQYTCFELHPIDDDPTGRGGGVFIMQMPIDDDRDVRWVSLRRAQYNDPDRDAMYGAARKFGSSQGRDQSPFSLQAMEGEWSVRDIGTSRITTRDLGGTFTGSVQVAHVMMRTDQSPRDPHTVVVWFDFRAPDPEGTGEDTLAIGQVIDPQQVQII